MQVCEVYKIFPFYKHACASRKHGLDKCRRLLQLSCLVDCAEQRERSAQNHEDEKKKMKCGNEREARRAESAALNFSSNRAPRKLHVSRPESTRAANETKRGLLPRHEANSLHVYMLRNMYTSCTSHLRLGISIRLLTRSAHHRQRLESSPFTSNFVSSSLPRKESGAPS